MLNNVTLCGRLTAKPELKTTPNGKNVTSFSVAVDRDFKNNGEKQTDFINIVAWGNTADFVCRNFDKGKQIIIQGRIETRNYTTNNGEKRYITEVIANNVYFAGSLGTTANAADFEEITDTDEDLPF